MKKFGTILSALFVVFGVALLGIVGTTTAASAHTGSVYVEQSCEGGSASVALDNNTTSDRTVDVISTIPGHPGFTGQHFDTSYGEIWSASWDETDLSGTVTLVISAGTQQEWTDSATLYPAEGCPPPKPEPEVVETDDEKLDCATKIVTNTHTVTTTDWVWEEGDAEYKTEGEWVKGEPVVETTETTRDATAEECPVVAPPAPSAATPVAAVTPAPVGKQLAVTGTKNDLWKIGMLLASIGGLMTVVTRVKRRRTVDALD